MSRLRWAYARRGMDAIFTEAMGDQSAGIEIVQFESIEALEAALGVGDAEPAVPLAIGLAFPDDFLQSVAAGQKTTVRVYVDANLPGGDAPRHDELCTRDCLRLVGAIPCRLRNRTAR